MSPARTSAFQAEDPTIAELLKPLGYATGQFGKNHLGDLNKYLPTVHGFDEFFGNLYHLNAEEEPELPDYPEPKEFPRLYAARPPARGPALLGDRGGRRRDRSALRAGGKQRIEDTGPLTKKRMETIDDETTKPASDFIRAQHEADTPFFVWMNMTHMHLRTHTKPESVGQAGRWQSPYHDTMIDHDGNVGQLLDLLDELGIAEDTIVIYCTDNGPHAEHLARRRAPRRSAARRTPTGRAPSAIPEIVRWPGQIAAGRGVERDHPAPRLAADLPGRGRRRRTSSRSSRPVTEAGDKTFKVHIDGYNLLPVPDRRAVDKSPRMGIIYFSDDCDVLGIRFDNWKIVFMEQRRQGTLRYLGRAVHRRCASRSSSTCAPTPSSGPTSPRTPTGTGSSTTTSSRSTATADRHPVPRDVQGVPAPPGAGLLHHRPRRRQAACRSWPRTEHGDRTRLLERDGGSKSAVEDFVARVCDESGPDYVPPEARGRRFDNDGTLWCEKPMPIQLDFTIRRLGELAAEDPSLAEQQPYKAARRPRPAVVRRGDGQALPGRRQRHDAPHGRDPARLRHGHRSRSTTGPSRRSSPTPSTRR